MIYANNLMQNLTQVYSANNQKNIKEIWVGNHKVWPEEIADFIEPEEYADFRDLVGFNGDHSEPIKFMLIDSKYSNLLNPIQLFYPTINGEEPLIDALASNEMVIINNTQDQFWELSGKWIDTSLKFSRNFISTSNGTTLVNAVNRWQEEDLKFAKIDIDINSNLEFNMDSTAYYSEFIYNVYNLYGLMFKNYPSFDSSRSYVVGQNQNPTSPLLAEYPIFLTTKYNSVVFEGSCNGDNFDIYVTYGSKKHIILKFSQITEVTIKVQLDDYGVPPKTIARTFNAGQRRKLDIYPNWTLSANTIEGDDCEFITESGESFDTLNYSDVEQSEQVQQITIKKS